MVGPSLRRALRRWGYVHLVGHPLAHLRPQLLGHAHRFFDLPADHKQRLHIARSSNYRGYSALGEETTGGLPDHKESLDLGLEQTPWDGRGPRYRCLHGRNQWPSERVLPGFRSAMQRAMGTAAEVGSTVLHCLLQGLRAELSVSELCTPEPFSLMRLVHYPAVPDGLQRLQGLGPHTDYGLLILALQDDVGGLRIQTPDGRWRPLCPDPERLPVLLGDMLELLTGGYLRATVHEVVSPCGRAPRTSIPMFFEPSLDARIAPVSIAPLPGEHVEASGAQPIVYGEHLHRALRRSFPGVDAAR